MQVRFEEVITMSTTAAPAATDPVIAVCATHAEVQSRLQALSEAGFDLAKLSIVGKGHHLDEHALGFYTLGDRVIAWGGLDSTWGAIWGMIAAPAMFLLPQIGLIAAAGPIGAALAAVLEGAVMLSGVSAVGAALASVGMPSARAAQYEEDLQAGRYLIVVHGSPAEVDGARAIVDQPPVATRPPA